MWCWKCDRQSIQSSAARTGIKSTAFHQTLPEILSSFLHGALAGRITARANASQFGMACHGVAVTRSPRPLHAHRCLGKIPPVIGNPVFSYLLYTRRCRGPSPSHLAVVLEPNVNTIPTRQLLRPLLPDWSSRRSRCSDARRPDVPEAEIRAMVSADAVRLAQGTSTAGARSMQEHHIKAVQKTEEKCVP